MWTPEQIPSLVGRVAVVTGGNAGIGLATVEQLALHGAKVYLGARSEKRAQEAIQALLRKHASISKSSWIWLELDLSSPLKAERAAEEFSGKESRLDILVNNAGMAATDFETTSEGIEMTMAVNHVGHWTFTYHLIPLLKKTAATPGADVRVITVSSSAESMAPATNTFATAQDLNDPCSAPGNHTSLSSLFKRYGQSKVANILFAAELQRRMDAEHVNIISISLNPGGVATSGGLGVWPWYLRPFMRLLFVSPEKGAWTSLFAATATQVRENPSTYKGKHIDAPEKVKVPSERAQDPKLAKTLWDTTRAVVGVV